MINEYHLIGCKFCDLADWEVYSDGKDFKIKCKKCGNEQKLKKENLRDKPLQVYPIRYF
jgi:hypothetical protein